MPQLFMKDFETSPEYREMKAVFLLDGINELPHDKKEILKEALSQVRVSYSAFCASFNHVPNLFFSGIALIIQAS